MPSATASARATSSPRWRGHDRGGQHRRRRPARPGRRAARRQGTSSPG
jgi:hypothetical protein